MAQARSAVSAVAATRVQVIAPASLGATAVEALRGRGIDAKLARSGDPTTDRDELPLGDDVIAWALEVPPNSRRAIELAALCASPFRQYQGPKDAAIILG
jgi:hypothetical protein